MGVETNLHVDGKSLTIERVQDVEPILEHNKMLRGIPQKSDWGRHVASVPNIVLEKWLNEEHARGNKSMRFMDEEFRQLVWRKLNDPEWAYLRTDK